MLLNLILLLPSFISLFWAITLLCRWKKNYRAQNILSINFLATSITFFTLANYFAGINNYIQFYKLDIVDAFITLSIYPIGYLFFKSLTDEHSFKLIDFIWFLPALVIGGGTTLLYTIMEEKNIAAYVQETLSHKTLSPIFDTPLYKLHYLISINLYNFFILIEGVGISIYAIVRIFLYHRRLNEFYSNLEGKSIENNYAILKSFLISILFSLVFSLLGRPFFKDHFELLIPLFIGWSSIIYYLGYQGYQYKYTAESLAADLAKADQEALQQEYIQPRNIEIYECDDKTDLHTSIKRIIDPEFITRFNHLIDEEKIYLQCDLRLDDVVRLMRTNRTYISRLINEEYHANFSDFINTKRIKFAQKLMRSDKNITQENVALQSGFSHVTSFSRTFKRLTKITPRMWLQSIS